MQNLKLQHLIGQLSDFATQQVAQVTLTWV
jgi:hypothetical protein